MPGRLSRARLRIVGARLVTQRSNDSMIHVPIYSGVKLVSRLFYNSKIYVHHGDFRFGFFLSRFVYPFWIHDSGIASSYRRITSSPRGAILSMSRHFVRPSPLSPSLKTERLKQIELRLRSKHCAHTTKSSFKMHIGNKSNCLISTTTKMKSEKRPAPILNYDKVLNN